MITRSRIEVADMLRHISTGWAETVDWVGIRYSHKLLRRCAATHLVRRARGGSLNEAAQLLGITANAPIGFGTQLNNRLRSGDRSSASIPPGPPSKWSRANRAAIGFTGSAAMQRPYHHCR